MPRVVVIQGFCSNVQEKRNEQEKTKRDVAEALNLVDVRSDPFPNLRGTYVETTGLESAQGRYLGANNSGTLFFDRTIRKEMDYSGSLSGKVLRFYIDRSVSGFASATSMKQITKKKLVETVRQANNCLRREAGASSIPWNQL